MLSITTEALRFTDLQKIKGKQKSKTAMMIMISGGSGAGGGSGGVVAGGGGSESGGGEGGGGTQVYCNICCSKVRKI
jgi:hypothetical protein